jgi:hypothetical protein
MNGVSEKQISYAVAARDFAFKVLEEEIAKINSDIEFIKTQEPEYIEKRLPQYEAKGKNTTALLNYIKANDPDDARTWLDAVVRYGDFSINIRRMLKRLDSNPAIGFSELFAK